MAEIKSQGRYLILRGWPFSTSNGWVNWSNLSQVQQLSEIPWLANQAKIFNPSKSSSQLHHLPALPTAQRKYDWRAQTRTGLVDKNKNPYETKLQ